MRRFTRNSPRSPAPSSVPRSRSLRRFCSGTLERASGDPPGPYGSCRARGGASFSLGTGPRRQSRSGVVAPSGGKRCPPPQARLEKPPRAPARAGSGGDPRREGSPPLVCSHTARRVLAGEWKARHRHQHHRGLSSCPRGEARTAAPGLLPPARAQRAGCAAPPLSRPAPERPRERPPLHALPACWALRPSPSASS